MSKVTAASLAYELYGSWICSDCGLKYGSRIPSCSTFHYDFCDYCNEYASVTESRDFGYPVLPVRNVYDESVSDHFDN